MVRVTEPVSPRPDPRRARVRRHRRERQIIVFGVLIIALAFTGLFAAGIYRGDVDGPFSQPFVTPIGDFESDVTLACPPANKTAMKNKKVALRVLNATDVSGLAGQVTDDLAGRGFVTLDPANAGTSYSGSVEITFGADGVRQAYTVARHFDEVELVYDNREGTLIDVLVGDGFAEAPALRDRLAPELASGVILTANAECLPVDLLTPAPAPRILPENPLDAE